MLVSSSAREARAAEFVATRLQTPAADMTGVWP